MLENNDAFKTTGNSDISDVSASKTTELGGGKNSSNSGTVTSFLKSVLPTTKITDVMVRPLFFEFPVVVNRLKSEVGVFRDPSCSECDIRLKSSLSTTSFLRFHNMRCHF